MCPQLINFNYTPPSEAPLSPSEQLTLVSSIDLSKILSETVTALYTSIAHPTILDSCNSRQEALRKLRPFRQIGRYPGERPTRMMNQLALITSSIIPYIYNERYGSIQTQSSLFHQSLSLHTTESAFPFTQPRTPIIELIEIAARLSHLNVYKERRGAINGISRWNWTAHEEFDDYHQARGITNEAIKMTHSALSQLSAIRYYLEEDPETIALINAAFYAIHCIAMKIIHNQEVRLFNQFDVNNTISNTIHILSQLIPNTHDVHFYLHDENLIGLTRGATP